MPAGPDDDVFDPRWGIVAAFASSGVSALGLGAVLAATEYGQPPCRMALVALFAGSLGVAAGTAWSRLVPSTAAQGAVGTGATLGGTAALRAAIGPEWFPIVCLVCGSLLVATAVMGCGRVLSDR